MKAPLPITVDLNTYDGSTLRRRIINGYVEVDGNEGIIHSRPALTLVDDTFSSFGLGMFYNFNDGKLYRLNGDTVSALLPVSIPSTFTQNADAPANIAGVAVFGEYLYGVSSAGVVYRKATPAGAWATVTTIGLGGGETIGPNCLVSSGVYLVFCVEGANDKYYYSTNGSSWTAVTITTNAVGAPILRMGYKQGFFYGFYNTPTTRRTSTITLATGWSSPGAWSGPGAIDNSTFVAMNNVFYLVGMTTDDVYSSSNGSTWATVTAAAGYGNRTNAALMTYKNTLVIAGGQNTTTYYSTNNGSTWTQASGTIPDSSTPTWGAFFEGSFVFGEPATGGNDEWYTNAAGDFISSTIGTATGTSMASFALSASGVLFIKTDSGAWTWDGTTFTEVTDVDYPADTVRGAVYLNGHLYVMESDGTIWNSAEDDFATWAGTDFITAEFEADGGVCLAKHGQYVVAFGTFTTEAFYDAGNATGSPLSPVDTGVLLIGCAHADSVAQIEQSIVWVAQQKAQGSTFHKGRFVVTMRGLQYERISTPDIERILDADDFSEVYADILVIAGHTFYILSMLDTDISVVFDFKTKLWHVWTQSEANTAVSVSSLTQVNGIATATANSHGFSDGDQVTIAGATPAGYNMTTNINVLTANTFTYLVSSALSTPATGTITATGYSQSALDVSASVYFDNRQVVQMKTTGKVYYLDMSGTSDNGAPIDFHIVSDIIDGGTLDRKTMGSIRVIGDYANTTALLRITDDEYRTYTKYRRVAMTSPKPGKNRWGSFTRRAVEFRHTLTSRLTIRRIEADIVKGDGNG